MPPISREEAEARLTKAEVTTNTKKKILSECCTSVCDEKCIEDAIKEFLHRKNSSPIPQSE